MTSLGRMLKEDDEHVTPSEDDTEAVAGPPEPLSHRPLTSMHKRTAEGEEYGTTGRLSHIL